VLPHDRRKKIYAMLQGTGSVSMADVRSELEVSAATVRRDLIRMEKEGLLERTRGGALLTTQMVGERLYSEKHAINKEGKERIGAAAAHLPSDYDTVFVNSGSTSHEVLRHLFDDRSLRVVTSHASGPLEYKPGSELIVTGGTFRPESNSFVGPCAHEAITRVHAKYAFIGVDGVSIARGLTTPTFAESEVARLMIQQTIGKVVVVADHSKIGVVADFVSAPIGQVDILITDDLLPREFSAMLAEMDIETIVADAAMYEALPVSSAG
jgi:DeoR/GlpR family transcriptional regulator of sugar metabolism